MNQAVIHSIYIAKDRGAPQEMINEGKLIEGLGLEKDRFFKTGIVTLIEIEEIEAFTNKTGLNLNLGEIRRNLVTKHIRLNSLVGQEFTVGRARLKGTELCEPCASLGKRLSNNQVTSKTIVRELTHKAGIRAEIINGGLIFEGTPINTDK
tara:strand:+ start:439 stop:891 length:453 start_codon:yes stop_codon:yes gene_type:complete